MGSARPDRTAKDGYSHIVNDRSSLAADPARRPPLDPIPAPDDEPGWIRWVEEHPISQLMGMRCLSAQPGHLRIQADKSWWPLNPNGAFQGGMVVAYADQCLGLASMTSVLPGCTPATATLTAEYVRPCFPPLTYDVRVLRSGRSLIFLGIEVHDRNGRLCAKITGTMATNGNSRFEQIGAEA